jgi:alkanesulfonate monooxygenase SsuD/methylene tetrahydromethanopterin reductase-like flavin-dependent oxidoreductase (luciferase family)
MYPKPVQQPHPPVHIGGHSDAALRRVALHGDGWFAMGHSLDELRGRLAKLDTALRDAGRSRADITVSVSPPTEPGAPPIDRATAERHAELGVDRLIVPLFARKLDKMIALLDGTAEELRAVSGAAGP